MIYINESIENRLISNILCSIFLIWVLPLTATVRLQNLSVEGRIEPLGIDVVTPRFGWQIESDKQRVIQKSYHILVASSIDIIKQGKGDIWDSGIIHSDKSQWINYLGTKLLPNKNYYWQVFVVTNRGSVTSEFTKWSTGLLSEFNWKGYWIGTDSLMPWDSATKNSKVSARYLRKIFDCKKMIKRAVVHVCGLGLYTLDINGERIGNGDVLSPVSTDYTKHVVYNTYDVTSYISTHNAILLTLEAGNYFAPRQQYQTNIRQTYGLPRVRLNLIIEYADGTTETIVTDETWKMSADGPVRYANYYDGESYDARKSVNVSSLVLFNDSKWQHACKVEAPKGKLVGNVTSNMHIYKIDKPVKFSKIDNKIILDFGTNGAGRIRMKIKGNTGDTIILRYAELLNKDMKSIYVNNLRTAQCTDYYISDGKEHDFTTEFVYHGFRYVEIKGVDISEDDVIRELIADRMDDSNTEFRTNDEILNDILVNARQGIRSNYKGIPIDCPQRDERMPWLGDRTMGCLGESYMMNNYSLYLKWIQDICDGQRLDGNISDVSPNYWKLYTNNITWPAALPFVANMLYRQYGDLLPMRSCYDNINLFLKYMRSNFYSKGLMTKDKYGDWCVPPEDSKMIFSKDSARVTDGILISSSYYYYLCRLMSRYAKLFGYTSDMLYYKREAETTQTAINRMYLKNGRYANNTVTANLLPLSMGIVPDDQRAKVEQSLIMTIVKKNNVSISSGIIGIQWLMRFLAECGHGDIAWKLATTTEYPSWGYMIKKGATTIWELWNGDTANSAMNSGNHVMLLGDLLPWCYENLGGIRPDREGFKSIILKPDFSIIGIESIVCSHPSPYGLIRSNWNRIGKKILWHIEIPANTTATIYLPGGKTKNFYSGTYDLTLKN